MNRHFALMLATGLLACSNAPCAPAPSGPQSYLDGMPQTKNDPKVVSVRILTVDGEQPHTTPYAVAPGGHWIVAVPQTASASQPPQTFALKVQPCTYYYLAARRNVATGSAWKPVVDAEETITSCNPADEIRKAQAAKAAPTQPRSPAASH